MIISRSVQAQKRKTIGVATNQNPEGTFKGACSSWSQFLKLRLSEYFLKTIVMAELVVEIFFKTPFYGNVFQIFTMHILTLNFHFFHNIKNCTLNDIIPQRAISFRINDGSSMKSDVIKWFSKEMNLSVMLFLLKK